MDPSTTDRDLVRMSDLLKNLEDRIYRIEQYLDLPAMTVRGEPSEPEGRPGPAKEEDDLEYEIGQNWFAKAGIVVIALGAAFVLTFPYEGLPSFLPGLIGYVIVAGILGLSRFWRQSFPLISRYLFGGAMALSYFATLRLYFFGVESPLTTDTLFGVLLLVVVVILNIIFAVRRRSVYLISLSVTMGYATAIVVGVPWFLLAAITALSALTSFLRVKYQLSGLITYGIALSYTTHFLWSINNPFLGNKIQFVESPHVSIYFLLTYAILFALGVLLRRDDRPERITSLFVASLNSLGSYGLFLLLTLTSFQVAFAASHIVAAIVFIALAIAFWVREESRYSTFVYAMLGYMALTVAILKEFEPPNIFVWLSLVSIIVVSTAVWFRSRFIIVANFFIYITIVLAAFLVAPGEVSVASVSFGVVALLSARILNWQQHRLELKTDLMRNAYLISAFFLFPYATYHLVPTEYLSVSWIAVALVYYALSAVIKTQKYRWMGHSTLILTILSVLIIGIIKLEPEYRVISFLALGSVLVVVSLVYNRLRVRRREVTAAKMEEEEKG